MNFREIYESISIAFNSIASNKLRAGLTTLGITIGVSTVIAMLSLVQGMNLTVKKNFESIFF